MAALESVCQVARSGDVNRLPPVSVLARDAGVAVRTMHKAVRTLCDRGVLTARPRGGIHVVRPGPGAAAPDPESPHAAGRFASVKSLLTTDILSGRYPAGSTLPPVRALCDRYGVGTRLMGTVLSSLVEQRLLAHDKRSLRVAAPQTHPGRGVIVMVAITAWSEFLCAVTPRAGRFWKTIEEECDQRNIGYLVVSYAQLMGLERAGDREARLELLMRRRAVLGFVVLRFGLTREQIADCLRKLDTTGLPVAMFEEQGDVPLRDLTRLASQSRACRLFHCAVSTSPGRALALHLLALGHRRIACFHIVDSEPWCISRLEGMRAVYGDGPGAEAVEGISLSGFAGFDDIRKAAEQWSPWTLPSGETITMQTLLSPIDSAAWQSYNANYVRPLFMAEFIARRLEPAFERLLGTPSVTAWAVVSDALAHAALDYLKRRRVPVPGHVALATFDNTAASLARGLTSVELNAPAIARLIIAHVTGDRRLLPPGREPVEAPCTVMARATTAPRVSAAARDLLRHTTASSRLSVQASARR